mgnify:CR=1 FL=1
MERIMIVDMLNMYYRAYIVDPSLSSNGKTIKEYKEGRKPIRLNRNIRNLSEEQELQNKIWQQLRLAEYINNMPLSQIMIDFTEADDVIAALCNFHKEEDKVIVSSDKDFFQLLDDTTVLYRPVQKEVMNKNRVTDKFLIHPNNFALARAIAGDKSDNLPGVGGAGLKTIAKKFPDMCNEETYTIKRLLSDCEKVENKLKIHNAIIEKKELIEKNYKVMQLYTPSISTATSAIIKEHIKNYPKQFARTNIRKMMIEDGFGEMNWSDLFSSLNKIHRG